MVNRSWNDNTRNRDYRGPSRAELNDMKFSRLADEVGGYDVLEHLDGAPLPDEPFRWTGIDDAIVPGVQEILEQVDRCCDALLDVEYRTACRRLLSLAAVGSPNVFRRKAKTESAAAAVVWIVGKANNILDGHHQLLQSGRIVEFLGATSSASGRAQTFLRAAGFGHHYLDTRLDANFLVSMRRRRIIEDRDRYRPEPDPCDECPHRRPDDPSNIIWLR